MTFWDPQDFNIEDRNWERNPGPFTYDLPGETPFDVRAFMMDEISDYHVQSRPMPTDEHWKTPARTVMSYHHEGDGLRGVRPERPEGSFDTPDWAELDLPINEREIIQHSAARVKRHSFYSDVPLTTDDYQVPAALYEKGRAQFYDSKARLRVFDDAQTGFAGGTPGTYEGKHQITQIEVNGAVQKFTEVEVRNRQLKQFQNMDSEYASTTSHLLPLANYASAIPRNQLSQNKIKPRQNANRTSAYIDADESQKLLNRRIANSIIDHEGQRVAQMEGVERAMTESWAAAQRRVGVNILGETEWAAPTHKTTEGKTATIRSRISSDIPVASHVNSILAQIIEDPRGVQGTRAAGEPHDVGRIRRTIDGEAIKTSSREVDPTMRAAVKSTVGNDWRLTLDTRVIAETVPTKNYAMAARQVPVHPNTQVDTVFRDDRHQARRNPHVAIPLDHYAADGEDAYMSTILPSGDIDTAGYLAPQMGTGKGVVRGGYEAPSNGGLSDLDSGKRIQGYQHARRL